MSQTTTFQAYSSNTPFLISRYTFSTLGPLEQLAAIALEQVGKVRIVDDSNSTSVEYHHVKEPDYPETLADTKKPPDSKKTGPAQVRPDEASHRQPVLRDGGYPNLVLPLGGDHERQRREGAGVFLGSYKISHTERQVTGLGIC